MIRKLGLTLKWLWRSWPLIVIAIIAVLHHTLRLHCNFSDEHLTPAIALVCQVIGGLLVLYSIDSKIGIFNGNSLGQIFQTYLNQFPYKTQTMNLAGSIQGSSKVTGDLEVSRTGKTNTIEGKIKYLQFQLDQLKAELNSQVTALKVEIEKNQEMVSEKIESAKENIQNVKGSLQAYASDDLKIQLFGLFLLFYGSITSYIYAA